VTKMTSLEKVFSSLLVFFLSFLLNSSSSSFFRLNLRNCTTLPTLPLQKPDPSGLIQGALLSAQPMTEIGKQLVPDPEILFHLFSCPFFELNRTGTNQPLRKGKKKKKNRPFLFIFLQACPVWCHKHGSAQTAS